MLDEHGLFGTKVFLRSPLIDEKVMDFFQHQDNARRRTKTLVFYYILALLALTLALYALVVFIVVLARPDGYDTYLERMNYCDPVLFVLTACGVGLLVGGASFFKSIELAGGGGDAVAQQLGGRKVSSSTTDFTERRLLNVVEELAIAAGINVPNVYILDHEESINAFAAGFSPNHAALGITRGTLNYLTRDELQGVIGHEFSHILNGDMRINIRLISILFGLNLLVIIGSILMRIMWYANVGSRSSRDDNKGGAGIAAVASLLGIGLCIIGAVGMFFSQLIQAAISRQREYLADASAVQFTRNPGGIAGALKKIGCRRVSSAIQNPNSGEASHMFIANIGGVSSFAELLATHPPLADRIRAIDPSFNGQFPEVIYPVQLNADDLKRHTLPPIQAGTAAASTPTPAAASPKPQDLNPLGMLERIGQLDAKQIAVASALLEEMPAEVQSNTREPFGARAVLFATLMSTDPKVRESQWTMLRQGVEPQCVELVRTLLDRLANTSVESKIPLVQQALPALRQLSPNQYRTFRQVVEKLVAADGQIDLFEYTLRGLLLNDLDVHFGLIPPNPPKLSSVQAATPAVIAILSNLAYSGGSDKTEIEKAFKAGLTEFGISGFLQPGDSCTFVGFDAALKKLSQFTPEIKKKSIASFMACISADNVITPREGELLRAICAMLGCPMPVFQHTS